MIDLSDDKAQLEMALRRVREGYVRIALRKGIIAKLSRTDQEHLLPPARKLLAAMVEDQAEAEQFLRELLRKGKRRELCGRGDGDAELTRRTSIETNRRGVMGG